MDNQMKKIYDKASLLKDIAEREQIIRNYQLSGILDRNKAINTIIELRSTDTDIARATLSAIATSQEVVPLSQALDQVLVSELIGHVAILKYKMLREV